jgi:glycosyltransferase involved in cell wall biosynthesis
MQHPAEKRLKIAVLVDLIRSPQSGGHVKSWEHMARAAAATADLPFDLTVFFSGPERIEQLSPQVTLRQLPQVFSTSRLKFLPYLPDHTDLSPWHPALARALSDFDVLHTTDAYFAFTRTAERIAKRHRLALTHSVHTDQPNYARIFTAKAIREKFGEGWLGNFLLNRLKLPEIAARRLERDFGKHAGRCAYVLASRAQDRATAAQFLPADRVCSSRLGLDKSLFNPSRANRQAVLETYQIPADRLLLLFVGRLDEGKNIYTLLAALVPLIRAGAPLHLIAAGIGPAAAKITETLPLNSTVAGFVPQQELARLYASCDALALASEVETRSMAMIEALASGLPVLLAAKAGLEALLPPTKALTVVTGSSAAWQDSLSDFTYRSAAEREAMRAAARYLAENILAGWNDILLQDFWPAWRDAAQQTLISH